MDKVEELREQVQEALNVFQQRQKKKKLYLQQIHKTILEILVKHVSEDIRLNIETYFEGRNERLHTVLKNIDESLNQASESYERSSKYRSLLINACNTNIEPEVKIDGDHILLQGKGLSDLENVSKETEQFVMQISEVQDKYCSLLTNIENSITQKISDILNDAEAQMNNIDQERSQVVMSLIKSSNDELEKAVQVLETMEMMKQQMEVFFQILRKPNAVP
ncbi:uncharacterized protein LOC121860001 [Homarus americanus]|uniref:Uncharacterized protein n=1 Tax=Homarus americanus TaxID=6706 RepID=A0A8J5N5Z4_HOMAM|nr:uncharacterized protein LOC121860001 [Homarus americanus]KAG7173872.1 hypothetical protein Hamer_G020020 [Homarus americanus]